MTRRARDAAAQMPARSSRGAAEQSSTVLARMIDSAGEAYCILDAQWRIVQCNPSLARFFGFDLSNLVGLSTFEINPKLRRSVFFPVMRDAMEKRTPGFRTGYSVRTGHWLMLRAYPFDQGIAILVHDISDMSDEQQRLTYLAMHDSLTALPNRLALQHEVAATIEAGRGFSVVFFDLDRFKNVNDSAGHIVGDRVLMEISARLSQLLSDGDRLYRIGGDEFVLLTSASEQAIDLKVGEMLAVARQPVVAGGMEFILGATAGCASSPDDGDSFTTLIRRADMAMYAAKREAAGTLRRYTPVLEASTVRKLTIEQALRRALAANHLSLHLQPKARLPDMSPGGAEALLRWQHPERGLIAPTELLEVAEGCGLLVDLDRWVLQQAMETLVWMRQRGVRMPIAVNLTAASFERTGLAQRVLASLASYEIEPALLELEITESCLMRNTAVASEILETLSAVGVRICVDDFGTGYSSLAYLSEFPVDGLKIDTQFVHRATANPRSRSLVRGIVALAHSLEMEVTAEGVETREQLSMMRELGCDAMQGFIYARPMSREESGKFARAHAARALATR